MISIIGGALIGIVAVYIFITGIKNIYLILSVKKWSAVSARIIFAEVRIARRGGRFGFTEWFYPYVEYEYTLDGKKICSNRVAVNDACILYEFRSEAERVLGHLTASSSAYVCPQTNSSVLVTGCVWRAISHYLALAVGGAVLFAIALILVAISI